MEKDEILESRIETLEKELNRIKKLYDKAVLYQNTDPEVALAQARKSAEAICRNIYKREGLEDDSKPARKLMLNDLIAILAREALLPAHISVSLGTIQAFGNFGTHDQGDESDFITEDYIRPCLQALNTVVQWYFTRYADSGTGIHPANTIQNERVRPYVSDNQTINNGVLNPFPQIITGHAISLDEWERIIKGKMVLIPGGVFHMGSSSSNSDQSPIHDVTISSFYMMKCPTTQREYEKVTGRNPSNFSGDQNRPVENVSWLDAIAYCNKLSLMDGLQPVYSYNDDLVIINYHLNGYRLPTEAEWEFACRGGGDCEYFWGNDEADAGKYAWFEINSEDTTRTVGTKQRNPYGLYDMAGNVLEWTNDWYSTDYYSRSEIIDPTGPEFGEYKVLRGGCWFNGVTRLRSAYRIKRNPVLVDDVTGFRCVARYKTNN